MPRFLLHLELCCRFVSLSTLSPTERVEVYRRQLEAMKTNLAGTVQKTKKLEKKYKVLTSGYASRQKELCKAIGTTGLSEV